MILFAVCEELQVNCHPNSTQSPRRRNSYKKIRRTA